MARKVDQKAVTAKMYRHFAVVTLIATAALAMASDEGNADKLNAEVAEEQARIAARGKDIKKNNQATVIKRRGKPKAATGWGSDEGGGGDFGGGESSSYVPQSMRAAPVSDAALRKLGMTRAQFMALPAQDQERMLGREPGSNGPNGLSPEMARRQEMAAAAALAQSGVEGPCTDC